MPKICHYTVTEKREVKVSANSIADAITLAIARFETKEPSENVWGEVTSPIRVLDIEAKEN